MSQGALHGISTDFRRSRASGTSAVQEHVLSNKTGFSAMLLLEGLSPTLDNSALRLTLGTEGSEQATAIYHYTHKTLDSSGTEAKGSSTTNAFIELAPNVGNVAGLESVSGRVWAHDLLCPDSRLIRLDWSLNYSNQAGVLFGVSGWASANFTGIASPGDAVDYFGLRFQAGGGPANVRGASSVFIL